MTAFWSNFLFLCGTSAVTVALSAFGLWLLSIRIRDVSIVDIAFPSIMLALTTIAWLFGDGAEDRINLILGLVTVWALRMSWHLVRRKWGQGEDPRYTKLRSWVTDDRQFLWLSLRQVFLLQGTVMWLTTLPVMAAASYSEPENLGVAAWMGTLFFMIGLWFETVADIQLTRFRDNPKNQTAVLRSGLWKFSRHPNYFGELCIWWGIFLVACDNLAGCLTIAGPIVYTYLLINVTGQRTLEKRLLARRPDYAEYIETTSGIIPRPKKRNIRQPETQFKPDSE